MISRDWDIQPLLNLNGKSMIRGAVSNKDLNMNYDSHYVFEMVTSNMIHIHT